MKYNCDSCSKKFNSENSLNQHKSMAHVSVSKVKGKIDFKKYFTIIALVLIVGLVSSAVYMKSLAPGESDAFAKCLTENGAIIYGNDYCSYTGQNLNFFGKSREYLNYIKCAENEALCDEKGVRSTPTWEINGEIYRGVLNFDKLSELTGCEF